METPGFFETFLQDFFDTMLFLIGGFFEAAAAIILGGLGAITR